MLVKQGLDQKKFDTRMIEKNLVRQVVTQVEVDQVVNALPDDSDFAEFVSIEELNQQKK